MHDETARFTERVLALAGRDGLSDSQLARAVGVSPATISKLRAGRRSPGRKLIIGSLRRWPELAVFLGAEVTTINRGVTNITERGDGA